MTNNVNQRQIYDKTLKTWIDVPADYYLEYDRERTAFRKRMQDHSRCCCPRSKWWLCDTFCDKCVFRRVGDLISIDATEGDDDVYMLDHLEAAGPRMEDVVADRDLLARMVKRLRELDPEADAILALWQEDSTMSDRAVARALGRPQHTFADQMKRYRTELRKLRDT
ncbi:MAG: sigma-70 family RNA polymerase sigma factor [Clostridia bacterium]|nr:sigma-70 family RNA polymerase sigma factor [Clostridia bacterium]